MTRSSSSEIAEPSSEPERELHKRKKQHLREEDIGDYTDYNSDSESEQLEELEMDNQDDQPMWNARQAAPAGQLPVIRKPEITADHFEVKGQLMHMVRENQFDGRLNSNPVEHMEAFEDLCDLYRSQGVSSDAIRLRVFPYSLTGDAKAWLKSLQPDSITTFNQMRDKFITRYFPPARAERLRMEITAFKQKSDESLYEAWERLKRMLRNCPQHGLIKGQIVQTFYRGIDEHTRGILDSSAGGVFMYKTPNQAYQLLEDMSVHTFEWTPSRDQMQRKVVASVEEDGDGGSESLASLANQFKKFGKDMEKLNSTVLALQVGCEACGGPHFTKDCDADDKPMSSDAQVNYLGNQRSGNFQGGSSGY